MGIIGLIGAMDEEVDILKEEMSLKQIVKRAKMDFYTGKIEGADVVIVRSGIGKVNAAMAAQILISEFNVDYIINTGVAGSLKREVNVGDIIISSDAIEYDFDTTAFGYKLGVIPRMDTSIFKADVRLVQIAEKAARDNTDGKVTVGRIISGDKFVSSKEEVKRLGEMFEGYAVEMEGASIAHVAYLNNIPFVIIRSISDNADDNATVDFNSFVHNAAKISCKIVKEMIALLK